MSNLNRKQTGVVVLMDLVLLILLCVAVYAGQTSEGDATFVFLVTFAPGAMLTVAAARYAIRRLAGPFRSEAEPSRDPFSPAFDHHVAKKEPRHKGL